jgi:hypothetical protein
MCSLTDCTECSSSDNHSLLVYFSTVVKEVLCYHLNWSRNQRSKTYLLGVPYFCIMHPRLICFHSRKLNTRGATESDPVIIDSALMDALQRYINVNIEEISCLVAKFLNMFLNDSPLVESYEADNFILRNGKMLSAWYDNVLHR